MNENATSLRHRRNKCYQHCILVDTSKYRQNKTRRANSQKNMTNPFKLFFVPILLLFSKFYQQLLLPRPSPSAKAVDDSEVVATLAAGDDDAVNQAEAPTQAVGDGAEKQAQAACFVVVHHMEWAEIVIAFCLAWAIDIGLLSVQVHSQLPVPFHLFSLAILLAFASTVVSKFINPKFLLTAQVLEKCGVFFTVTAFFIAITISFPFCLKFTSWVIYAISALAILICSCF